MTRMGSVMRVRLPGTETLIMVAVAAAGTVLSCLRAANTDDAQYLSDTMTMADCLRRGQWFGNEGVGLHGFLFKLPAALLFLLTGSSVFAATMTTVCLAAVTAWLCFRLIKSVLNSEALALAATWLVVANYHFVLSVPTFLREIPALLATLLFLDSLLKKRNEWVMGLLLLLVLDAKEYMFFALLPAYALWSLVEEGVLGRAARTPDRVAAGRIALRLARRAATALAPGAVYLALMFCTGAVPLNMFAAALCGVSVGGLQYMLEHFLSEAATANLWEGGRAIFQFAVPAGGAWEAPAITANILLSYVGKLLYPRTFSFISVPRLMVIPAVVMSVRFFRQSVREGRTGATGLPLFLWVYLFIYVFRASHGRYLLPVVPLLAIFFVQFLADNSLSRGLRSKVTWASALFAGAGLFFELNFLGVKIVMDAVLLALMVLSAAAAGRSPRTAGAVAVVTPCIAGLFCMSVGLASSLLMPGQIGNCLAFGYDMECRQVMDQFPRGEKIWVNNAGWSGHLMRFYRGEPRETPEWHWDLKPGVPKKKLLRRYENLSYSFDIEDMASFKKEIEDNRIRLVGLVVSRHRKYRFPAGERLGDLKSATWLNFERTVQLKNKDLYVFRVGARLAPPQP